jgi:hypothetical protein
LPGSSLRPRSHNPDYEVFKTGYKSIIPMCFLKLGEARKQQLVEMRNAWRALLAGNEAHIPKGDGVVKGRFSSAWRASRVGRQRNLAIRTEAMEKNLPPVAEFPKM